MIRAMRSSFDNRPMSAATPLADVISHLFRLPAQGPADDRCMQLAGFPAGSHRRSVVSVLCRMAIRFSGLWSDGVSPDVIRLRRGASLCLGRPQCRLWPDPQGCLAYRQGRPKIRRVSRGSSRSAPPNSTPPSSHSAIRCSTMRLANERDQALLRSAVSDAAANLLSFVPSLGTREVLAFGEGVALPTRLRFKEVPVPSGRRAAKPRYRRCRRLPPATTCTSSAPCSTVGAVRHPTHDDRSSQRHPFRGRPARWNRRCWQPSMGLDPDAFSLLKKPLR